MGAVELAGRRRDGGSFLDRIGWGRVRVAAAAPAGSRGDTVNESAGSACGNFTKFPSRSGREERECVVGGGGVWWRKSKFGSAT